MGTRENITYFYAIGYFAQEFVNLGLASGKPT
jgi:hypothetical protein